MDAQHFRDNPELMDTPINFHDQSTQLGASRALNTIHWQQWALNRGSLSGWEMQFQSWVMTYAEPV